METEIYTRAAYREHLDQALQQENLNVLDLSDAQLDKIALFLDFMAQTNKKFNLTASITPENLVGKHALDSILLAQAIQNLPKQDRIVDIGSGGGFPAMIVAICLSKSKFTLIDSTAKKCAFLQEAANKLQISHRLKVMCGRAEEIAHQPELREIFHVATAKAVASLKVSAELVSGFLAPEGVFMAQKTQGRIEDEIIEARQILGKLFFEMGEIEKVAERSPQLLDYRLLRLTKQKRIPHTFPRNWKAITG